MILKASSIAFVFFALAASAISKDKKEPVPELNQKVLTFAREHKGKKVGDGTCVSLATAALAAAGAREFPESGGDDPTDYVWGELIENPEKLLPGDVLQFRDALFEGRDESKSWRKSFPHHTAIVAGVSQSSKTGLVVTILQQNAGRTNTKLAARQVVKEDRLRFRELQQGGSVKGYRPRK